MDNTQFPKVSRPALSFVIIAYNEEKLIGQCIESVMREQQRSGVPSEIIVVNNASTDSTEAVARSFDNVVVVNEFRKGMSQARQAGFLAARGELVANLDADILLPSGWVDKVIKKFASNPKLVAYSGPYVYYDLNSIERFGIRLYYYMAYGVYIVNRFILRAGSMLQGGNYVVRRSALEQVGGYNAAFTFYGEDVDMARRLHKVGPVVYSLRLFNYTSGRRIKAEGLITMAIKYPLNYFSTIFLKRPFTKDSTDIRSTKQYRHHSWAYYGFIVIAMLGGIVIGQLTTLPAVTRAAKKLDDRSDRIIQTYNSKIQKIHSRIDAD